MTCRQRAYRRRKADAASAKATEDEAGDGASAGLAGTRSRSASAEAIMIRVRLDEPGDDSLNELALAALLLAQRLRSQECGPAPEPEAAPP